MKELGIDSERVWTCVNKSFTKEDHIQEHDCNSRLKLEKEAEVKSGDNVAFYPVVLINKQPYRVHI